MSASSKSTKNVPATMVLEENEREINITQKWFSWSIIIPFIFCIAWFYISITMVRNGNLVPPAFGIGIIIIYSLMAGFLNRTIIKINNSEITVQHTPVPCPFYGNQKIDSSDLMQVVLQEFHKKGRRCCRVNALFQQQSESNSSQRFNKRRKASFITNKIETYLKLKEKKKN